MSASVGGFLARLSPRFVVVAIALALFGGSMLLYAPSVGFGFIDHDDVPVLLEHPNLYAQDSLWRSLHEIFVGYFPREEPLLVRDVSWALDARVFGFTNPVGYHLGNILLNAVNVVLFFLLLLHATRRLGFAALSAALFAVLAVHVEPVCWIMGRKDLLSAFFIFLALLAQSLQLRQERRGRRWLLAVAVFLLYPLAVLSKFSAIILVLVLAAHRIFSPYLAGELAPSHAFAVARWPRRLVGLLPHCLVGVAIQLWYQHILNAFQIVGGHGPPPFSATHLKNLATLIPLSLQASLFRIFSAAEHSIAYLRPSVTVRPTSGELALAFATLGGMVALTAILLRFRKDLAFFPVAFLLFLLPYFNFVYVGIWAADRYSYLASIGVAGLLAAPVAFGWRSSGVLARRLAIAGAVALGFWGSYQIVAGRAHQLAFRGRETMWAYETGLPRPSTVAFVRYANLLLYKASAAEPASPRRRELLEAAVAAAQAGVRYYATIPWRPAPAYVGRERIQLASLYTVLAAAAGLAGDTLEHQLELHRTAFKIAPADLQTEQLAIVLFKLALRQPRDLAKARESLVIFRDHVRYASRDRLLFPRLHAQLAAYRANFPELAAEVDAIEAESLR